MKECSGIADGYILTNKYRVIALDLRKIFVLLSILGIFTDCLQTGYKS